MLPIEACRQHHHMRSIMQQLPDRPRIVNQLRSLVVHRPPVPAPGSIETPTGSQTESQNEPPEDFMHPVNTEDVL